MSEKFRVIITPEATDGIRRAYEWIKTYSPETVNAWMNGLFRAIQSLDTMPRRASLAFEHEIFDEELRQLLYGKHGQVYRILFTIRDNEVQVLFVRHSAQKPVSPEE
jgi:plasmid stabilization system protein ParE